MAGPSLLGPCRLQHPRQCFASPARHSNVARKGASLRPRASAGGVPSLADTARTLVDLATQGTLSTLMPDGTPLGTSTGYVLDGGGQPILRLRAAAQHTRNLRANPAASLLVQPPALPARALGRLTLLGRVEPLPQPLLPSAIEAHAALAAGARGVDRPAPGDLYARLAVRQCFIVDQLGGRAAADLLERPAYDAGTPDALRYAAARIVEHMNASRAEDLFSIGADALGCSAEDLAAAEMVWVDSLGAYVRVRHRHAAECQTLRVCFARPAREEREARSALTMLAQQAAATVLPLRMQESWERRRPYTPVRIS